MPTTTRSLSSLLFISLTWLGLVDAASSSALQFLPVLPTGLVLQEDVVANISTIQLDTANVDPTIPIYVVVSAQHGAFTVDDVLAYAQARVFCTTPASFASSRVSKLVFEATVATTNTILGSLTYLAPPHYHFDYTATVPCLQPSQSPEFIQVDVLESALLPAAARLPCDVASSSELDPAAVRVQVPVAIAAINAPPTFVHLPSTPLVLPSSSCTTFPATVADIDVAEVPNRGGVLRLTLTSLTDLTLSFAVRDAVYCGVAILQKTVVSENATQIVATALTLQAPPAGLNAFLPHLQLCVHANTSLTLLLDDRGGCGSSGLPATTAATLVLQVPSSLPPVATAPPPVVMPASLVVPDSTLATPLGVMLPPGTSGTIEATGGGAIGIVAVSSTPVVTRQTFAQTLTLSTTTLDVRQTITLSAPFAKEVQLLTAQATQGTPITESAVQLSLAYNGVTSSAIVDLTLVSAPELAAALTQQLINAGEVVVTGPTSLDAFGSVTWAVTFQTLATVPSAGSIPLLTATPIQFPLGTTYITRQTAGTQVAPAWTLTVQGTAGGTFVLDIAGTCTTPWPAFTTAPLAYQATVAQVQAALQAHHAIDQVTVTAVGASSYRLVFWTNVESTCRAGLVLTPRYFLGGCMTCAAGITSATITPSTVASQEMQQSDTWRLVSPLTGPTPWLSVFAGPNALQSVLPDGVALSTTQCNGLVCVWNLAYTGPLVTVEVGSANMQLGVEVVQAQPKPWSQGQMVVGKHWSIPATASDAALSRALSQWCRCAMTATSQSQTATSIVWTVTSSAPTPLDVRASDKATWMQTTVSPITSSQVPAVEHHLRLSYTPPPVSVIAQQTIACNAVGGTFTVQFQGERTAALPFNASPLQLQQALATLSTLSNVYVPPSGASVCAPSGPPVVVWFGTPGIQTLTLQSRIQPSVQALTWTNPAATNLFVSVQFTYGGVLATTTLQLAADRTPASALALQTQLAGLVNAGSVVVSPVVASSVVQTFTWWITFTSLHGPSVPLLTLQNNTAAVAITQVQPNTRQNTQVRLTTRYDARPAFGSFRLNVTSGSATTTTAALLPFGATASALQSALQAIPWLGLVAVSTVSTPSSTQYTLTFLTNADPNLTVQFAWNDSSPDTTCIDCTAPSAAYTLTADPPMQATVVYTADLPFPSASFQVSVNGGATTAPLSVTSSASTLQMALQLLFAPTSSTSSSAWLQVAALPPVAGQSSTVGWTITYASAAALPAWSVTPTLPDILALWTTVQTPQPGFLGPPPLLVLQPTALLFPPPATSLPIATVTTSVIGVVTDVPNHILQLCTVCTSVAAQQQILVTAAASLGGALHVLLQGQSVLLPLAATQAQAMLLLNTLAKVTSVVITAVAGTSVQYLVTFDSSVGVIPPLLTSIESVTGTGPLASSVTVVNPGNAVGGAFGVVVNGQPAVVSVRTDVSAPALQQTLGAAMTTTTAALLAVSKTLGPAATACWRLTFSAPVDVGIVRPATTNAAAAGLTGQDADVSIQIVQAMPAFRLQLTDGTTAPPLALQHVTATQLQQVLQTTWPTAFPDVVVTNPSANQYYVSNYSISTLLQIAPGPTPTMTLMRFYTGLIRVASTALVALAYQPVRLQAQASLDTIVAAWDSSTGLVQTTTVFVPSPATGAVYVAASRGTTVDLSPSSTRVSTLASVQYMAVASLNATIPILATTSIAHATLVVTGATISSPSSSSSTTQLQWTNVSPDAITQALQLAMIQPQLATASTVVQAHVVQLNLTIRPTNSVFVLSFGTPHGTISGQFQLLVQLAGTTCTSLPIVYSPTATTLQATFDDMQTRCGGGGVPSIQKITITYPIPVAQVQSTSGQWVWSINGVRTPALSIAVTAAALQSALRVASASSTLTVALVSIDVYTMQYQVQSALPVVIASSAWTTTAGAVNIVTSQPASTAWQLNVAVQCGTPTSANLACTLQFLNDVPTQVTVAANQLTSDLTPTTQPQIQVQAAPPPPLQLFAEGTLLDLQNVQGSLGALAQDVHVTLTSSSITSASPTSTYTITYTRATPLSFHVQPMDAYDLTTQVLSPGQLAYRGSLALVVDSLPPLTLQLRLPPPPSPPPVTPVYLPPLVAPVSLNYTGSTPPLTVLPGQSIRLALSISLNPCTFVQMSLNTTGGGMLWFDQARRYHVQYIVGQKEGNATLLLQSTCTNLQKALQGLYYTASATFVGQDTLRFQVNTSAVLQIVVHVPLTLSPPQLSPGAPPTIHATEDTAFSLANFSIVQSPTTPATCHSRLVVTCAVEQGLLHQPAGGAATLQLHAAPSQTAVSLAGVSYTPRLHFAGIDMLSIEAVQTTTCDANASATATTSATLEIPILVEPVPDPIELVWPSPQPFPVASAGGPTPLPPIQLVSVDATVAFFPTAYMVALNATTLSQGAHIVFGSLQQSTVVASVADASTYLTQLVYTPPSSSLLAMNDVVFISAHAYGSTMPPTTISLNVSLAPSLPTKCVALTVAVVDAMEDTVVNLMPLVSTTHSTLVATLGVKQGWLSHGGGTWAKQLSIAGHELLYKPPTHFFGEDWLTITCTVVDSSMITSAPPPLVLPVAVHPVNNPPVWVINTTSIITATSTGICSWSIQDIDPSDSYRVTFVSAMGSFTLPRLVPGIYIESRGPMSVQFQGSLINVNQLLQSCSVTFQPNITTGLAAVQACVTELTGQQTSALPTCATVNVTVVAPPPPPLPRLQFTKRWVGVEDTPGPILGLRFAPTSTPSTQSITLDFDAAKGVVEIHAWGVACVQQLSSSTIAGDVSCLSTILASNASIWYHPHANTNGYDTVVITYALDQELALPVYVAPVLDLPQWRWTPTPANSNTANWQVAKANQSSMALTSIGNLTLVNGENETKFDVDIYIQTGQLGYAMVAGLYYPIRQDNHSLTYTPIVYNVQDTLLVEVANASSTWTIPITVLPEPLYLQVLYPTLASSVVPLQVGAAQTLALPPIALLGSPDDVTFWNVIVTCQFGQIIASNRTVQSATWRDRSYALNESLASLVYVAPMTPVLDVVTVHLWDSALLTVVNTVTIFVQTIPVRVPFTLTCPPSINTTEGVILSLAGLFALASLPDNATPMQVTVDVNKSSSALQLAMQPSLQLNTLAWTRRVWFQGAVPAIASALALTLSLNANASDVLHVDVATSWTHASCSVPIYVAPINHVPVIQTSRQPWRLVVLDTDAATYPTANVTVVVTATTTTFHFASVDAVVVVNATAASNTTYSAIAFDASLAAANHLLATLTCTEGYGGVVVTVDDHGHNYPAFTALQTSTFVTCPNATASATLALGPASGPACVAGLLCSLPSLRMTSASLSQVYRVTAKATLGFVPEIQTVHTSVDEPLNHMFEIAFMSTPVSASTQLTLTVTWQASGAATANTASITWSALAVATTLEEVRGAGPGGDLGESVQSKLQQLLPLQVHVQYGTTTQWIIEVLNENPRIPSARLTRWSIDLALASTTNGLVASIWTSQPSAIVSGSFALSFAGATTGPLECDSTAADVLSQLEALPTVELVAVTRSAVPDASGGYTWSITFLQPANDMPLLVANATRLRPTPMTLLGVGNISVGSQAQVSVTRVQAGMGQPPAAYRLNLSATHVDLAFDIAVQSPVPMAFTLAMGATISASIQFNAVAQSADEGADQSLGGRVGESIQAKLTPLFPPTATIAVVRTSTAANAYAWHVVIGHASATQLLPTVATTTCGSVAACSVQVTLTQAPNALGGSFALAVGGNTTSALAVGSTAAQVTAAVAALPWVSQHATFVVRSSSSDLQLGQELAIVFLTVDQPTPPLVVHPVGLTGLGAFANLTQVLWDAAVAWNLPPESRTVSLYQRNVGSSLVLQGSILSLKTALTKVQFQSTTWFGTLQFTLQIQAVDSLDIATTPSTALSVVVPVSPTLAPPLSLVLDTLTTYEDVVYQFVGLHLVTTAASLPYAAVNLTLTVDHGVLYVNGPSTAATASSSIVVAAAVAVVPSILHSLLYFPPPNYHGRVQLVATHRDQPAQVFRFDVLPVNDPPLLHIHGSIEGPFATSQFPVFAMAAPQDTLVTFPSLLSIEDVDAVFYEAYSPVLTLTVQTPAGELSFGVLEALAVVTNTPTQIVLHGTLARLNTALQSLMYRPPQGLVGSTRLTLVVQDLVDGRALQHRRQLAIEFTEVWTLPKLRIGQLQYNALEDVALALSDIQIDAPPPPPVPFSSAFTVSYLVRTQALQPDTHSGPWAIDNDWRMKSIDSTGATPQWFCSFQSRLFFAATSATVGRELFVSDGGAVTTVFADLNPGTADSSPKYLTVFQGNIYFQARGLDLSYQLTAPGVGCAGQRTSSAAPDVLYVVAQSNTWTPSQVFDCPAGYAWMTTAQGQQRFTGGASALPPFVYWNQCGWSDFVFQGSSRKYFRFADSAVTNGYKHAGRPDAYPVEYSALTTEFAGIVCVQMAPTGAAAPLPSVLWQVNGASSLVSKVDTSGVGAYTSPRFLTTLTTSPWLIFQATSLATGAELYRTNGLTTYVDDLYLGPLSAAPSNFTEFQGRVVFAATSDLGRELWASTSSIVVNGPGWRYAPVADLAPGSASSAPQDLVVCNGLLFFTADDGGVHGREVWTWDGVHAPQLVLDLFPGSTSSDPAELVAYNGNVYFRAQASLATGYELYSTNGVGITLVKDIALGAGSSYPSFLTVQSSVRNSVLQTVLVFCVRPTSTQCLWYTSSGTTATTMPLVDSTAASFSILPDSFQVGTFQGSMVYAVARVPPTPTSPPPTPPTATALRLEIAASLGTLTLDLFSAPALVVASSPSHYVLQGSATALNQALTNMVFLGPLNYHSTWRAPLVQLQFNLSARALSSTATAFIFVHAVDDPPVWTVPQSTYVPTAASTADNLSPMVQSVAPFTLAEDTTWVFPPLGLRAVDCVNGDFASPSRLLIASTAYWDTCVVTVTLTVAHGILSGVGPSISSSTVTLQGSVPLLNQQLQSVQYTPAPNFFGADALTLTATLVQTSTVVLPLVVTSVNDVPYISLASDYVEAWEDKVLVLSGLVAHDDDGDALQVTLTTTYGSLDLLYSMDVALTTPARGARLVFTGSLAQVNTALANLSYVSGRDWNSDIGDAYDSVELRVVDVPAGASSITTLTIRVWPTPDPIVIALPQAGAATANVVARPSTLSIAGLEDTPLSLANVAVSSVDADPAASVVTLSLFVLHGALALPPTAGVLLHSPAPSMATLQGSYSRVNAALASLVYTGVRDFAGQDTLTITANAVDGGGVASLPATRQVTLVIEQRNDPPVWSAAAAATYFVDLSTWQAGLHLPNVSFVDVDASTSVLELSLDVKDGAVTLAPDAAVAIVHGSGMHDTYLVVRGTQVVLNAALAGLVFELDGSAFDGQSYDMLLTKRPQIRLTIDDLGNTGFGGPNLVSTVVSIQVVSRQNQPPIWSSLLSLPLVALEDVRLPFAGLLHVTDPDVNLAFGSIMQLNVACRVGQVILSSHVGLTPIGATNTTSFAVQGSLEHINHALESSYYLGPPDWYGQDQVTLTIDDMGFSGSGGPQSARLVVPMVVRGVCDGPSWVPPSSPTFLQVYEDQSLVLHLLALADPDATSLGLTRVLSVHVAVRFGGFLLASTRGLHITNAVVHDSLPPYFASAASLQGTIADVNLALQGLIYKPAVHWSSHTPTDGKLQYDSLTATLQGVACDTITLTDALTLQIHVAPVNNPPTLALPSQLRTAEDTPLSLGPINIDDVDSPILQVSIACTHGVISLSNPTTGSFWTQAGNATGDVAIVVHASVATLQSTALVFTPAATFYGLATVLVTVSDFFANTSALVSIQVDAVMTPMQILVPPMTMQLAPARSLRIPNVLLPPLLEPWTVYAPPSPSRLFKSEMTNPDTYAGPWGAGTDWRNLELSPTASRPTFFTSFRGRMIFQATDTVAGSELWQSDGQTTMRVADMMPGPASATPTHLMVFSTDSKLYFAADGIDTSWQIPSYLADTCQGFRQSTFHGGKVAFMVAATTLWDPNAVYDCPAGYQWATTDDAISLFPGTQGGSTDSPEPLTYVDQCGWLGYTWGSHDRRCFRFADSATSGACKHAGKRESFRVEVDFATTDFAGVVCVQASTNPSPHGRELWSYDGTTTTRIADLNPGPAGSNPAYLTDFRHMIVFQATDHDHGVELWSYDGVHPPTLAADIASGNSSSHPKYLTFHPASNWLFFSAETAALGAELWRYDGTFVDLVSDICVGACSSQPQSLVVLNTWLLFQANDGVHGAELWKSNGVVTALVADVYAGAIGSDPMGLTVYNGKVYFSASNGIVGRELYATDGTTTTLLADLASGFPGSNPSYLTVASPGTRSSMSVAPLLVFVANTPDSSLWSYDGVSSPQLLVASVYVDVAAMAQMPPPISLGVNGHTLYYPATSAGTTPTTA
ncbi:hypothetical protein As57867_015584, partial [Aphanomyces stellatus]